ncbi:MAG: serpin family protein, partial [Thermovirgaceae bacterium]|nr:serpin family protein [Thermovirgaceae bacterium]
MKKRSGVSIIVAVTALCIFAVSVSADDVTERMLSTASDNGAFAFDLFSILRQEKGNLFFSPYSISSALAMTYGGARGQTAAQMEEALRFTKGQKGTHEAFRGLG